MTEKYQTLTLKDTHEQFIVNSTEYPMGFHNLLYIRFIVYYHNTSTNEYIPKNFLTVQPKDILSREMVYNQQEMDEMIKGANAAREEDATIAEYRAAAEEEMKLKAKEIPPETSIFDNENDDVIDSDFQTPIDPYDPNYL